MKVIIYILLILTTISCTTLNYTYEEKDEIDRLGLTIYKNPKIEKRYSIVPYISIAGIGLGGGYLLGEHTYNNMINNGSPKDSAIKDRNFIWGIGAIGTALGIYYLVNNDSVNQDWTPMYTRDIEQWYANTVDFNKNTLVGYKNNSIYSMKNEDIPGYSVNNLFDLKEMLNAVTNYSSRDIIDTIALNSFYTIPKNKHYNAYKILDKKYDIYLKYCIDYLYYKDEIIEYSKEVKNSTLKNKDNIITKSGKVLYDLIDEELNLYNIDLWLDNFSNLNNSKLNAIEMKLQNKKKEIKNEIARKKELARLERERKESEERRKKEEKERKEKAIQKQLHEEFKEYKKDLITSHLYYSYRFKVNDCVNLFYYEFEGTLYNSINRLLSNNPRHYKELDSDQFKRAIKQNHFFKKLSQLKSGNYEIVINEGYILKFTKTECQAKILRIDNDELLIKFLANCNNKGEELFVNQTDVIQCN